MSSEKIIPKNYGSFNKKLPNSKQIPPKDFVQIIEEYFQGHWEKFYSHDRGAPKIISGSGENLTYFCPFHNDKKTPNLTVRNVSGLFHCFVCKEGGNGIQFWQKRHEVDFPTACKDIIEVFHIPVLASAKKREKKTFFERYSTTKKLPIDFLKEFGISNGRGGIKIPYKDQEGKIISIQTRIMNGKQRFCWRKGDKAVLYGLWRLSEYSQEYIYLVEGASDCHTLWFYDLPALGIPGKGIWKQDWVHFIESFEKIYVIQEPDAEDLSARLADSFSKIDKELHVVLLPEKDVSELHIKQAENFFKEIQESTQKAQLFEIQEETGIKEKKAKPTQSQRLIRLACDAELFYTPDDEAYARISIGGHKEIWPIRSKGFKRWLLKKFYDLEEKPPGTQAMQDALGILEAKAVFEGEKQTINLRMTEKDGAIYLDLCNEDWQVIEITEKEWKIVDNPPVRFRRSKGMLSYPLPKKGGSIRQLKKFINIGTGEEAENNWVLIVSWLVASLRDKGPYPILILQGEQGSAKSTTERILKSLIDPAIAPLKSIPREERDLMITANNSWILAFDNLSSLPSWLSDALCRLATGGGFSTRELYSDADEIIFDAMRPMILNGIENIARRQDLLDRTIIVTLPPILEEDRRPDEEYWEEFNEECPEILGAFLDIVVVALRNLKTTKLKEYPRMADFAKWVSAAEPALPWEEGQFMKAYIGNRAEAIEIALEDDVVASVLRRIIEKMEEWEGSASELLDELEKFATEKEKKLRKWPKTARGLSGKLRRAATGLRSVGVEVEFFRDSTKYRRRKIRIKKKGEN